MTSAAANIEAILDKHEDLIKQSVVKCMQRVNQEPSASNLRDLKEAKKQLAEYQQQNATPADQPSHFKTASDAARWIEAQQYLGKQGIVGFHQARREVGKLRKDPKDGYLFATVKKLADKTWGGTIEQQPPADSSEPLPAGSLLDAKERYLLAQAQEKEWKLKQIQGLLIDVAEEERRDVAVILGIRRHLETAVPDRAISLLAKIKNLLPEEQHGIINAYLPEIIEADRDVIAEIFDTLATQGGIYESI